MGQVYASYLYWFRNALFDAFYIHCWKPRFIWDLFDRRGWVSYLFRSFFDHRQAKFRKKNHASHPSGYTNNSFIRNIYPPEVLFSTRPNTAYFFIQSKWVNFLAPSSRILFNPLQSHRNSLFLGFWSSCRRSSSFDPLSYLYLGQLLTLLDLFSPFVPYSHLYEFLPSWFH